MACCMLCLYLSGDDGVLYVVLVSLRDDGMYVSTVCSIQVKRTKGESLVESCMVFCVVVLYL